MLDFSSYFFFDFTTISAFLQLPAKYRETPKLFDQA
jgi:hypothetical protein